MPQIALEQISKTFTVFERPKGRFSVLRGLIKRNKKEIRALQSISFSIDEGELVGYIGPNGAGKSTTVKVMGGILTPESGRCEILGRVPWKNREKHVAQIGVVFGQRSQLWWDVPICDSFALLRDIYGIPHARYLERLQKLASTLDLSGLLDTPCRQLSLGQRMRCEVAAALLHSPRILFLDEPTIGLDAVSKLALREFLKQENQQEGVTMILTTHDMDDVEALCNRVMTIGHGRLLFDGTLPNLKKQYAPLRRIRARLAGPCPPASIPGAREMRMEHNQCTLLFDSAQTPAHEMVTRLVNALPIEDMVVEEQDIDEIIAAMYKELDL